MRLAQYRRRLPGCAPGGEFDLEGPFYTPAEWSPAAAQHDRNCTPAGTKLDTLVHLEALQASSAQGYQNWVAGIPAAAAGGYEVQPHMRAREAGAEQA